MSWTCKREAMYTGLGRRITSLNPWYRSAAGITFNSSFFEYFSIQQITLIYIYLLFHFRMFTISKLRFKIK